MQEFSVVFATPSVGMFALPLPIAGQGQLYIDEQGLKLSAFLPTARPNGCLQLLPGLLLIAAIVAVPIGILGPEEYQNSPVRFLAFGVAAAVLGPKLKGMFSTQNNAESSQQPVTWTFQPKDVQRVMKNGEDPAEIRLLLSRAVADQQKKGKSEVLLRCEQPEQLREALRALGIKA